MPHTVNGIGTWYFGKKNRYSYEGICQFCNNYATLSSYDTREWLTVVYLPIIPLRKKRIMDSCPACTQHRPIPLKEYYEGKEKDYDEAYEKVNAAPRDVEAAIHLLQTLAAYQDMETFEETADQVGSAFSDNPKVQAAIGWEYYRYGPMSQAREYFERSLVLHDDDDVHEGLGFVYLRMNQPDQTAEHFQFILEKRDTERAGVLMALVDGYQGQGRHQEALDLLEQMAQLDAAMPNKKEFKKAVKLSQKNLGISKPIKSKQYVAGKATDDPTHSTKKTWGIAAMVLVVLALIFVGTAVYKGFRPNVYLVNGLTQSYEVTLNGKSFTVPAYGYTKISIPEGDISMSVKGVDIDDQQFTMSSSFLERPFMDRVYVISPDTLAPVMWMKIYYAENPGTAPDPQWKLHAGKVFYVFDEVDLSFEEFPDQVSLPSSTSTVSRNQISMLTEADCPRAQLPELIREQLGEAMLEKYLTRNLYCDPDNPASLNLILQYLSPEKLIEMIRPGLDIVPVRINWHRYYQNSIQQLSPGVDLVAEYRKRIEQSPDDPALQYLMGRVIDDDPEASMGWLNQSISGPRPCPYGYIAIAYYLTAVGEFDAALAMSEKAIAAEADNPNFVAMYFDLLLATGQLDKALSYCHSQRAESGDNYGWVQKEMTILSDQGKNEQAEAVFVQWYQRNQQICSEEIVQLLKTANQRECAYVQGDFEKYLQVIGEPNDPADQVILALNFGNVTPPEYLENADQFDLTTVLMFYVSEAKMSHAENAQTFLDAGIEKLRAGQYADRLFADCLKTGEVEDAEKLYQLAMDPLQKAVLLTVLGVRCPEHQTRFFELAEKLNYRKEFPYHYLKSVHAGAKKSSAAAKSAG
ncbi:MAG: tetratricopeptide repeat protein [Planctomycetota bacterium]|jgi:tetratricopeptide (TPR) repeat protein